MVNTELLTRIKKNYKDCRETWCETWQKPAILLLLHIEKTRFLRNAGNIPCLTVELVEFDSHDPNPAPGQGSPQMLETEMHQGGIYMLMPRVA